MIAVYIASVLKAGDSRGIYPKLRRSEIEGVSDVQLKQQKISSWKLLEKAIADSFGYTMRELNFTKNGYGKWECDKVCFSISHTKDAVAVAISDTPVGVDMESVEAFDKRHTEKLCEKILCPGESVADNLQLLKLWTQKESIYKYLGSGAFVPNKICAKEHPVHTFLHDGYTVSVCGDKYDFPDICIKTLEIF